MDLRKIVTTLLVSACIATLSACGGGDGNPSPPPSSTHVSGVASKGVFINGTVRVYALNADGTETLLKETTTNANGAYDVDLGRQYNGPILVKAFGDYADEATGTVIVLPESAPLTAALPASEVTNNVKIPVTPFTDLAVRKAREAGNVANNIGASNRAVAALVGVDIVNTMPVRFQPEIVGSSSTSEDQKKYTAALAAISQYVANNSVNPSGPTAQDLQNSLSQIGGGITLSDSNGKPCITSPLVLGKLQQAADDLTTNPNTAAAAVATGTAGQSILDAIGGTTDQAVSYRLRTAGAATDTIEGMKVIIKLPAALAVPDGALKAGTVEATVGSSSSIQIGGYVKSGVLTLDIATIPAIANTDFVELYFVIPASVTAPATGEFTLSSKVVDSTCTIIPGATVELHQ